MKTLLFTLVSIFQLTNVFTQTEVLLDSVSQKNSSQDDIVLRCSATINYEASPLFVIDGVLVSDESIVNNLNPEDIDSINVLKNSEAFGFCNNAAKNGVILISTKSKNQFQSTKSREYPFKVHTVCNENWRIPQDMYNSILAKVPNVQIVAPSNWSSAPKIKMRGDDNTIVIVDGVRYDASILNTLNPIDIESVKVSNSPAAQNYFINN